MQSLIGQMLDGKYDIIRQLGRGGMGAVYFAIHLGTKRPVALKVIIPQFMKRTEFIERFKREAEASGRLHHPNVVNVTDFGFAETSEGQIAFLVMEYLEGCTLGEILEEDGKLSLLWTIDILEQVCSAVDFAHRQGIIHRDLKPDNIWLEPNQRGGYTAKVLDFGIAKLLTQSEDYFSETTNREKFTGAKTELFQTEERVSEPLPKLTGYETLIVQENSLEAPTISQQPTIIAEDSTPPPIKKPEKVTFPNSAETEKKRIFDQSTANITRVGSLLGTPYYMSPEQCRSERLGTSSDIYSLGVIAFQMLTGKLPFEGEPISVLSGHLQSPPPPLSVRNIPAKVGKAVRQALSKEPIERPASAEIFAAQLRANSEGVITIFRRSLIFLFQNFSKLIWFSLLFYYPALIFGVLMTTNVLLGFNGIIPANISFGIQKFFSIANIAVVSIAETLVTGAVAWIVVQYIDTPLRQFLIWQAMKTLWQSRKEFAWIIPLRIFTALFASNEIITMPVLITIIFNLLDTILFFLLPCVVVIEHFQGFAAFKRSWKLSLKTLRTLIAAAIFTQIIFLVVGIIITTFSITVSLAILRTYVLSADLPYEDFVRLGTGIATIIVKFFGVFLLPFFAVVHALVYLKARNASGESTKVLLDQFKDGDLLQSKWQRRIRQRSQSSKRSFSNP